MLKYIAEIETINQTAKIGDAIQETRYRNQIPKFHNFLHPYKNLIIPISQCFQNLFNAYVSTQIHKIQHRCGVKMDCPHIFVCGGIFFSGTGS